MRSCVVFFSRKFASIHLQYVDNICFQKVFEFYVRAIGVIKILEFPNRKFFPSNCIFLSFSVEEEEEADEELETKAPAVCDDSGVLHRASSRSSLASEASAQNLDLALVQGLTPFSKPLMATSSDPEATPAPFPGIKSISRNFYCEFKFTKNSFNNDDKN